MRTFASIYVMADKFQIQDLKAKTVLKMQRHHVPASIFFNISKNLYSQIPESDSVWRDYFTMEARKYIVEMDTNKLLVVMEKALLAGSMAMDVFKAQCKVMEGFQQNHGHSHRNCHQCFKLYH